jgi:NAD(P)-dependent dehydrogenase (short-subunit alcohol dehydrogenase family)
MSTRPFEGSVVVVTGGAAGIGKALNTSYLKTAESELCVIAAKAHPSP